MALWYVPSESITGFSSSNLLGTNHSVEPPFGVFIHTYTSNDRLFILCREWLRLRLVPPLRLAIRQFLRSDQVSS